ncbi:LPXTG cell wall anchor domain-containing protein [Kitasatospora sp. MAP5-34]|uniref:LPXTG cell wall anchor domain-containing protein n=1 Tax=Kitasatospora sp. MAP5-34 TaxID=3035102 RepID=UPI0024737273|nr:LPXTG cell wall anchor domain-containing protein [Kitasatospora sp. MAP5-34]MDH6576593.1 LPXTG-motif cell wall-anchored protein [Kitasatospora sp. MAP5-34]
MAVKRRISGGMVALAAGVGLLAPLALAGVASAHTQEISSTCGSVTVKLRNYNPDAKYKNTVSVTIGGKAVIAAQQFPDSFEQTFNVDPKHTAPIDAVVKVATSENPDNPAWNKTLTESIAVCPVTSPSPSPSHSSSSPSPSPSHSVTPSVHPSTSKPATATPSPTGPVLASTGGGGDAPLIAAAGAGVIVLGGGLLFASRRRSARRH